MKIYFAGTSYDEVRESPMSEQRKVDLSRFTCPWWTIGRGQAVVTLWRLVGQPLCRWLPSETLGDLFFNRLRIAILRFFGAAIGEGGNSKLEIMSGLAMGSIYTTWYRLHCAAMCVSAKTHIFARAAMMRVIPLWD
jgi:hypothetical protein